MRYFLLSLIVWSALLSCQTKKTDKQANQEKASKKESVFYEPSELARLMLEMYAQNKNWKEEILKGNIPSTFPEKYKKIHTAKSINESAGGEFYNALATKYLETIDAFTQADQNNVKQRYQAMINTCVQCHQEICPGPVPKIKKLLLEK